MHATAIHKRSALLVAAWLLATTPAAWANDAGLRQCRALSDAQARLACYDALPLASRATTAPAAPAAPATSAAPATPATAAVPSASAAPPAAAAAVAPMAAAASSRFGLEQARPAETEMVVSRIPGRFEGWRPNSRLVLANGQVWQISDGSSASLWLMDPEVRIRRAPISGFEMFIEGVNQRPRVRRIS